MHTVQWNAYFKLSSQTVQLFFKIYISKKSTKEHCYKICNITIVRKTIIILLIGLPRAHPESYHSYMWNNFFKHIDIDPANASILDGNITDLEAECEAFEKKITEAGGIDLFVGGQFLYLHACLWLK